MPFMSQTTPPWRHERLPLRSERGQTLVELALALPVLLLLVLGVVDFGRALGYKNDMTHLANSAARYAAVNKAPTGYSGQTAIRDGVRAGAPDNLRLGTGPIPSPVQIIFSFPGGPAAHCVGDAVKVTVTAHYNWLGFLKSHAGLPTLGTDMTSSSTMRIEKNFDFTTPSNNAYQVAGATTQCP